MELTQEAATILTVVVFLGGLVLLNDLFFSKRKKSIKIFEFLFFFALFLFMILSTRNLILFKGNEVKKAVDSTEIAQRMDDKMMFYDEYGNPHEGTVGDFMRQLLISPVISRQSHSTPEERLRNNVVVGVVAAIYFVYWLVLLMLFEKEDTSGYHVVETEKLFEKYSPIVAACLVQNRNALSRDMIAELLHMISVGKINLRIVPVQGETIKYRYMISENKESTYRLDMLEQEIFDIFFEDMKEFNKGVKIDTIRLSPDEIPEVDLIAKFDEIVADENIIDRLKYINSLVQKRLNAVGANKQSVPPILKFFNNILLAFAIILISFHIVSNGLEFSINSLHIFALMYIGVIVISILPVIYILILLIYGMIRALYKSLQDITSGITGRKLIAKTASIVFATFLMLFFYALFARNTFAIYDILLIGATLLVVLTDDYMLKHDTSILNDYYNLKALEEKLENTLMNKENIEYMKLWNMYYPYSVAFGITEEIDEESDIPISDVRILTPEVLKNIYYVSKAHLDIMWDIDLSPAEKAFGFIDDNFNIFDFYIKSF